MSGGGAEGEGKGETDSLVNGEPREGPDPRTPRLQPENKSDA